MHEMADIKMVEVVDFVDLVTTCDSLTNKLWCMTGHPGSGKSFLCKHLAFLYGTHSLSNFLYVVSIPCRSEGWHELEKERHEGNLVIDAEFIESWLLLSMSAGANWSKPLCEHLVSSEGQGLLIIMDGADEFIQNVPFKSTLLHRLLQRQFLARSTIFVTSRPSAWSDLLYHHGTEYRLDANFQVLGFSPPNRDLYFAKRIATLRKLNAVHELFARHEIKLLSLVPVNASLFSALFNASDSILSQTLSHLYTQLILYLIRRQLSRIGLTEQSEVLHMSAFHPAIRECIHEIGLEANQGIFKRELTSDKHIPLKIGGKAYSSERLGLMQVHIKVDSLGKRFKVWTFQHLTIQEYMAAVSICDNSWTNRCLIIRYLTSSTQYLALYKMVIRFVSGVLRQNAARVTPILCHHTFPDPISFRVAPMHHQLVYLGNLVEVSDWVEFSQSFLYLCTVISEIDSCVSEHFAYFLNRFPDALYLYLNFAISPNEWHCFLQSFRHIREFQVLIYFQSDFVSPTQFSSLLLCIASCNVRYLALFFGRKDFTTVHSYTSLLASHPLPARTKISIDLKFCNLTYCNPSQPLIPSTNRLAGSINLFQSDIYQQTLLNLTNQFSSIENLKYCPKSNDSNWPTIQGCIIRNQVKGLVIEDLSGFLPDSSAILSSLSSLKELSWVTNEDCYEVLPHLSQFNSLTSLYLVSYTLVPLNESRQHSLMKLIDTNRISLRDICLFNLHRVGIHSWESFFSCVTACSNLISLTLQATNFSSHNMSCWYEAMSALNSLVYLSLYNVLLQDAGMVVLCHSLSYHPAIRKLRVTHCELSSASCRAIMCLIQTLRRVKLIEFTEHELSSPDPQQLQLLVTTAEECSIKITFP